MTDLLQQLINAGEDLKSLAENIDESDPERAAWRTAVKQVGNDMVLVKRQQNQDLRQELEGLLARHRRLEPEEHAPCICWGIDALLKKMVSDAGKGEE
jgi:hypothetical protein